MLIVAVDAATGERATFDNHSGVALPFAVAASRAMPGICPPVTTNGHQYLGGGLSSATNAGLAAGSSGAVVIAPLAHLFSPDQLRAELGTTDTGVTIMPNPASVDAIGHEPGALYNDAGVGPAFEAGMRQAGDTAEGLPPQ